MEEELSTLLLYSSVEVPQPRPSLCNLSMMHQDVFEPTVVDLILPSSLQRLCGTTRTVRKLSNTGAARSYLSLTAFCCAQRTAQVLLVLFFSHAIPL